MERFLDKPYYTYSVASALRSGLMVRCPKCGGPGRVTSDGEVFSFRCERCCASMTQERTGFRCKVENLCRQCGRYYRVQISDKSKGGFPVLRVPCPYCGHEMPGRVEKIPAGWYSGAGEIRNGREPFFGLELWFLTSFRGRPVWALNREHLVYLIGFLEAGLREYPLNRGVLRTQADMLPSFMKTAKNRAGIVKRLRRMQET